MRVGWMMFALGVVLLPALPAQATGKNHVAIIGDSIASGLAYGLARFYGDRGNLAFDNCAINGSGLLSGRTDWIRRARTIAGQHPYRLAVLQLGTNDALLLKDDADYRRRVRETLQPFVARGIPVACVETLPSLRLDLKSLIPRVAADIRQACLSVGGTAVSLPSELNRRRLRAKDDVHLTAEGYYAMATSVAFALARGPHQIEIPINSRPPILQPSSEDR